MTNSDQPPAAALDPTPDGAPSGGLEIGAAEAVARRIAALDQWLFGLSFFRFCLLVFAVLVLQNGVWVVPIVGRICHLASDVTRQLTQDNRYFDYLYTSLLDLLVGHWTGAWRLGPVFAFYHLVLLGAGIAGLLRVVFRKFGDRTARMFVLAFATVPLSNVLLTWLGLSDVYVFILSTAMVLADAAALLAVLAFLLGVSHFEQGFIIACGLSAARVYQVVRSGRPWRQATAPAAAMVGGVLAARLFLHEYFTWYGFHFETTRVSAITVAGLGDFLSLDARHFGTLIFSLHGCYWLVVLGLGLSFWQTRRGLALGMIALQLAFTGITMLTLDETRIFSLLAWPFLVFLLRPDIVPTEQLRRGVVAAYAAGLLVPRLIVWGGHIHSSALYSVFVLLGRFLSGHGLAGDPEWMSMPFK